MNTTTQPIPHHRNYGVALLCSAVFLLFELAAWPFAERGICDDWSYIWTARVLADTGHVVYNGWATAVVGAQLYAGAAMIKVLGFSLTAPRLWMIAIGALTCFLLQRTLQRCGLSSRNAALGTLAFVLTPLYMELSATFMTDIPGLFAMVLCLYCCYGHCKRSPRMALCFG